MDITVGTVYDCEDGHQDDVGEYIFNPSWRHNMIGCCIISVFESLYHMNISYVVKDDIDFALDRTIDVFALPLTTRSPILAVANPVDAVVHWRFGFILRRSHDLDYFEEYYTKPFTRNTWDGIIAMGLVGAFLFFLARWWEKRLLGDRAECSLVLEVLLIIGGYCQHVFSVDPIFISRRTMYFSFFLYSYIIYVVYTSNLLSHLVNDVVVTMTLNDLVENNFEFVTYSGMQRILSFEFDASIYGNLGDIKVVDIDDALEAVRMNQTALLSDYRSIYPIIKRKLSDHEISELIEIDLNSNVKKYMFASKKFLYTENLKISILRAKESGILSRLMSFEEYQTLTCETALSQEVKLPHIMSPLIVLFSTYVVSAVILIVEVQYHKRNRLWPYLE